jgi:hypothetical protein
MKSLNHYPLFTLRSPHTTPPTHYNNSKSSTYPLGTSENPLYRQGSSKSESTSSRCRDKYRRKKEERILNQPDAITIIRAEADAFQRQLLCQKKTTLCIDRYMDVYRKFHVAKGEGERASSKVVGPSSLTVGYPATTGVVYVVIREIAVSHCVSGMEGEVSKRSAVHSVSVPRATTRKLVSRTSEVCQQNLKMTKAHRLIIVLTRFIPPGFSVPNLVLLSLVCTTWRRKNWTWSK